VTKSFSRSSCRLRMSLQSSHSSPGALIVIRHWACSQSAPRASDPCCCDSAGFKWQRSHRESTLGLRAAPLGLATANVFAGVVVAQCRFDVQVVDVEPPAVTCPGDITTETDPGLSSGATARTSE
jgi:hypothetical protein